MRYVHLERGTADDGGVRIGAWQAQILAQRHGRCARLGRGAEQPVHVAQCEAAVRQGAMDALRHQVERAHVGSDRADIGFCGADDRGAAAGQAVHGAASAGMNTGYGGSSPSAGCMRSFTRMPMRTSSGAISSTRLIMRNPSSMSISATL